MTNFTERGSLDTEKWQRNLQKLEKMAVCKKRKNWLEKKILMAVLYWTCCIRTARKYISVQYSAFYYLWYFVWELKLSNEEFLKRKKIHFFLCVWLFCLQVCLCSTNIAGICWGWKSDSDTQEVKIQMVVNYHVSSGKLGHLAEQSVLLASELPLFNALVLLVNFFCIVSDCKIPGSHYTLNKCRLFWHCALIVKRCYDLYCFTFSSFILSGIVIGYIQNVVW